MKNLILGACACALLTACDTHGQSALTGAAAGAALGAAVSDRNEKRGALIGAAAGAASGLLVHAINEGPETRRECYYLNNDGSRTYVTCPN